MATNGSFESQDQLKTSDQATTVSVESSSSNANLSKDEVGWYFVEQYYTTLSKTPEKLHVCQAPSRRVEWSRRHREAKACRAPHCKSGRRQLRTVHA